MIVEKKWARNFRRGFRILDVVWLYSSFISNNFLKREMFCFFLLKLKKKCFDDFLLFPAIKIPSLPFVPV